MSYPKTDTKTDFTALEQQVLAYWRENNTFHKSLEQTRRGRPFSFYDGPPFANGLPHWGHLGVTVVKDMVSRFQTMHGRYVVRELGWDCHGLPAENSVEKKQGRSAKNIVAEDGITAFPALLQEFRSHILPNHHFSLPRNSYPDPLRDGDFHHLLLIRKVWLSVSIQGVSVPFPEACNHLPSNAAESL